ncbi:MAG: hypothetical protein ACE5GE_03410 [Phycisphaerae bacterium]
MSPPAKKPNRHPPLRRGSRKKVAASPDTRDLHDRWSSARRVISQIIEQHGAADPQIWEQGAYQLWLWLVVELLVVRRDEIDIADLTAVSKMLHDQRKLTLDRVKHLEKIGRDDDPAPDSKGLPAQFNELVRQVYGTTLQEDQKEVMPTDQAVPAANG